MHGYYYATHILNALMNTFMHSTWVLRGCQLEREWKRHPVRSEIFKMALGLCGRGWILPDYGSLVFFMIEKYSIL
jgi:hypothetical protein